MRFALAPKAEAAGYRVEAHDRISSTNAEALSRARAGDPGKLWVVSPHQVAGRGRRGSDWQTPPGNLAASLLNVVSAPPRIAATLGFVAGLALDEALRRLVPDLAITVAFDGVEPVRGAVGERLRLKWPNDVLLDGGKLAGILLEAEAAPDRTAVVVGFGVNVLSAPRDLPYRASALADLAPQVTAADVFDALSESWTDLERLWAGGMGFAEIRDLWLSRAAGLGDEVAARVGDTVHRGIFDTIDEEGRLVIRTHSGATHRISAGEVHLSAIAAASA